MFTLQITDISSAIKTLETTSFDAPENRNAREFLRTQMDDKVRDAFDDAVTSLRKSLLPFSPEDRAAHRGFRCSMPSTEGRVPFVVEFRDSE